MDSTDIDRVRIGPYRLVTELGRGGMGTVDLAVRSDLVPEARGARDLETLETSSKALERVRKELSR